MGEEPQVVEAGGQALGAGGQFVLKNQHPLEEQLRRTQEPASTPATTDEQGTKGRDLTLSRVIRG